MTDPVRIAVVGCSGPTYGFLYDCTKDLGIELVGASDPDADNRSRFQARYHVPSVHADYREMLETVHPEAVLVFPRDLDLFQINKACMEAGANVLSERPGCGSLDQGRELAALQQATGRFVAVRFNKRHLPGYRMAREIIGRPEFGRPTMYMAKYQAGEYASERAFIDSHIIHHLDLIRFFLGDVDRLHVERIRVTEKQVGFNVSFVAAGGAKGVIQSGSLQSRGGHSLERVEITGVGRSVIVENLNRVAYHRPGESKIGPGGPTLVDGSDTLVWDPSNTQLGNYTHNGFEHMLREVVDATRAERTPQQHMGDVVRTLELLAAFDAAAGARVA